MTSSWQSTRYTTCPTMYTCTSHPVATLHLFNTAHKAFISHTANSKLSYTCQDAAIILQTDMDELTQKILFFLKRIVNIEWIFRLKHPVLPRQTVCNTVAVSTNRRHLYDQCPQNDMEGLNSWWQWQHADWCFSIKPAEICRSGWCRWRLDWTVSVDSVAWTLLNHSLTF